MAISASDVKALRDETGAGMMDCKRALEEAGGDVERAKDILRQRGQAKSLKREGRATGEGCVAVAADPAGRCAAVVELNCETDFVGRGEDFRGVAQRLADKSLATGAGDAAALAAEDVIAEAVSRVGEAVRLGRVARWEAGDSSVIAHYLHTATYRVAVLVELAVDGGDVAALTGELLELGRDLGMQVCALRPLYVERDAVPAEMLEREKENLRQAADMAGKPPAIQERIIAGRLDKGFYQQVCLLDQEYAREGDITVGALLQREGQRLGTTLRVVRFERIEVGGA